MTHKEKILSRIIHSGPLLELNFYQVNDTFFELSESGLWIIDTGIELRFKGGIVSAAWDSELESYVMENDSVKNIYKKDNLLQLENDSINNLKKFVGLNVTGVNFKTLEFEYVADYTMRTEKEKRFVELIINFESQSHIQVAFVNYYREENKPPQDFSFDLSTELLISTKKIQEIKT